MKNQKEIIRKIKAVGLQPQILMGGFAVYPANKGDIMYTNHLKKLIRIAEEYGLYSYIDFEDGFVRLHKEDKK